MKGTAPFATSRKPRESTDGCAMGDRGTFVDYDLDGKLDIAVTSYLEFDRARVPVPGSSGYCRGRECRSCAASRGLPFSRNRLLRNLGNGKFADVSEASGFGRRASCYAHGRRHRCDG